MLLTLILDLNPLITTLGHFPLAPVLLILLARETWDVFNSLGSVNFEALEVRYFQETLYKKRKYWTFYLCRHL